MNTHHRAEVHGKIVPRKRLIEQIDLGSSHLDFHPCFPWVWLPEVGCVYPLPYAQGGWEIYMLSNGVASEECWLIEIGSVKLGGTWIVMQFEHVVCTLWNKARFYKYGNHFAGGESTLFYYIHGYQNWDQSRPRGYIFLIPRCMITEYRLLKARILQSCTTWYKKLLVLLDWYKGSLLVSMID